MLFQPSQLDKEKPKAVNQAVISTQLNRRNETRGHATFRLLAILCARAESRHCPNPTSFSFPFHRCLELKIRQLEFSALSNC